MFCPVFGFLSAGSIEQAWPLSLSNEQCHHLANNRHDGAISDVNKRVINFARGSSAVKLHCSVNRAGFTRKHGDVPDLVTQLYFSSGASKAPLIKRRRVVKRVKEKTNSETQLTYLVLAATLLADEPVQVFLKVIQVFLLGFYANCFTHI